MEVLLTQIISVCPKLCYYHAVHKRFFCVRFSKILKWWKAERWCLQHFTLWLCKMSHRYWLGIPCNKPHYFGAKRWSNFSFTFRLSHLWGENWNLKLLKGGRLLNWQQYPSQSFHVLTWWPWLHIFHHEWVCGKLTFEFWRDLSCSWAAFANKTIIWGWSLHRFCCL